MEKFLGKFSPQLYAILRIVVGFLFLLHGLQKVFGMLGQEAKPAFSFMWFGGVIELVGGLMVMIGAQASWAAFLCSGTMAVGYFMFHQPKGALPAMNGGDAAALNAFIFLYIAAKGSGIWSLDAIMGKKRGGD